MSAPGPSPSAVAAPPAGPFRGGRRWMLVSFLVGAVGLLGTLVGGIFAPRQAAFSYLSAWLYWGGIAVAGLLLLMILHAAHARWSVVARRPLEAMGMTLVPLAALFLPVLLTMRQTFPWVSPDPSLGKETLEKLEWRHWWLNVPFFAGRSVLYLGLFAGAAWLLYRASLRQDEVGGLELTRRQRKLSAGAIPVLGTALTFASYDWILSLSTHATSQILSLYYFGGSMICALGLLIVVCARATGEGEFGAVMAPEHFHSLGKLLLGFVAFWAWMAYSQFMLIWVAHLPEEITLLVERMKGGWGWMGVFLIVGQFALPFFALLSRDLKRHRGALALVALWLLVAHYVDIYWLVMPNLHPQAPRPSLFDLTALLGLGGVAVGYGIWLLRGRNLLPVKDPYLAESLLYGTRTGL